MQTDNIVMAVMPEEERQGKVVSDAPIARKLLRDGFRIIDIKPKRGNEKQTIFVFEKTQDMLDKLNTYVAERREKAEKAEKKEK